MSPIKKKKLNKLRNELDSLDNSLLKINTIGSIPVLKLYQKACIPVLIGSALEIAAAA